MAADGRYEFGISLDLSKLKVDIKEAEGMFRKLEEQFNNPPKIAAPTITNSEEATRRMQGLNVATQQIARELPAATMGLNTFFLAISNNIPVLTDQIKSASNAGMSFKNIAGTIIKSLASWQTVLVLAITALSMYSDEIFGFIKRLFTGKEAIDSLKKSQEELNEVKRKGILDSQEEIVKLRLTAEAAANTSNSMEERKRAMQSLRDEYGEYLQNLSDEKILNGEVGDSIDKIIEKIVRLGQAREALNKLVENAENRKTLEGAGDAWKQFEAAAKAYKDAGEAKKITDEFYSIAQGKNVTITTKTTEYNALDKAEKALRKAVKELGEEGENIAEMVKEEFGDSYYEYLKSMEAGENELKKLAEELVIEPDKNDGKKAGEEVKRNAKELKSLTTALDRDAAQAEVDAMKEGTAKKLAQIQLDYQMREQEIIKQEKKLKELQGGKLTEAQTAQFAQLRAGSKAKMREDTQELYLRDVSVEIEEGIAQLEEAAKEMDEYVAKSRHSMQEYVIEYGSWKEKIVATTEKYNDMIAEAETEGEKRSLAAERDAILAAYEVEASGFAQELVGKTAKEIDNLITQTEELIRAEQEALGSLSADSNDAANLRKVIATLRAELDKLKNAKKNTDKEIKAGEKDWAGTTQVFQNISKAASDAADGLEVLDSGAASLLRTIAELSGSAINLIGSIQMVSKAFEKGAQSISAMEKASVILAVIGAVIQVVSALWKVFDGGEDSMTKTIRQFQELNEELAHMRRLAQIEVEDTIFGAVDFGRMQTAAENYRDAIKELNSAITDIRYRNIANSGYNAIGNSKLDYYNAIHQEAKAWESLGESIANMQVQVQHSTWFRSAEYRSLGEMLPGLFNNDGSVNMEALQEFADSDLYDKLDDRNKELIDNLLKDWEYYEEAMDAMKDYLSGVFGELGNTMTDALVESFEHGTDAALAFGDSVSNMLEQMAKDMVQAMILGPLFEKAQEDILAMQEQAGLSSEEMFAGYTKVISGLIDEVMGSQGDVEALLELFRREAEKYGLTIFDGDDREGSSRGIAQASQNSVDELNGRATAIQGHTYTISQNSSLLVQRTARILEVLMDVRDYASELERLGTIESYISAMRSSLNDMATRGVKAL